MMLLEILKVLRLCLMHQVQKVGAVIGMNLVNEIIEGAFHILRFLTHDVP